jgi:FtsP/CotA-like multicopper oxidase with cupredoxin domain
MQRTRAVLIATAFAAVVFAGCSAKGSGVPVDPVDFSQVPLTGRTIHLKMSVIDIKQELYPGLPAYLWAFCAEPLDPNDAASAAAIEYWQPLASDKTNIPGYPPITDDQRAHCSVPGPTLHFKQGDHVIVDFANSHVHPHTIHWHGQYVPNDADGVPGLTQDPVKSGDSYTYDFIAYRAGTLWYHCHVDGQLHVMQGLYGMAIVDPADPNAEPHADAEAVMVLSTMNRDVVEAFPGVGLHNHPAGSCYISGIPNCQDPPVNQAPDPDVFLINGHSYPLTDEQSQTVYHVDTGKTLLIRILNAGETFEPVHLHGHDMTVVAEDGIPLANPITADTITVGPAERFDVIVHGNNPGVWAFHSHTEAHLTNDHQAPGGMHTMLIDGPMPADMHAFQDSLPGGIAYAKPVYMPQDYRNLVQYNLGTAAPAPVPGTPPPTSGVSQDVRFPVELPCAVKSIRVEAFLQADPVAARASQLTVVVVNTTSGGSKPVSQTLNLGADPSSPAGAPITDANWTAAGFEKGVVLFAKGNYTIQVRGTAASAAITLQVLVDYWDSFDQQKLQHHLVPATPLCGPFGDGGTGPVPGAPPV